MRWHGTTSGNRLRAQPVPAARWARGWPASRARSEYETTSPYGTRRIAETTSHWNAVQPSSSMATSANSTVLPSKYAPNLWTIRSTSGVDRPRTGAGFAGTLDREGGGSTTPPWVGVTRAPPRARARLPRKAPCALREASAVRGRGNSCQTSLAPSCHTSPTPQPSAAYETHVTDTATKPTIASDVRRSRPFPPPRPAERAGQGLRTGIARARGAPRPPRADALRPDRDPACDRRQGDTQRRDLRSGYAPRPQARPCDRAQGQRDPRRAGDRSRGRGLGGLAPDAVGRARRRLPPRRRPAVGPMARHPQRRDHAGAVEDRASGGDRRGLRAHRLLPLQRRVHAAHLRGAAPV